jgi:hypothetical protein
MKYYKNLWTTFYILLVFFWVESVSPLFWNKVIILIFSWLISFFKKKKWKKRIVSSPFLTETKNYCTIRKKLKSLPLPLSINLCKFPFLTQLQLKYQSLPSLLRVSVFPKVLFFFPFVLTCCLFSLNNNNNDGFLNLCLKMVSLLVSLKL